MTGRQDPGPPAAGTATRRGGYDGADIVFIVGSPRSGTTWLQRLLSCHPSVRTGQESNIFCYVAPQLQRWRAEMHFDGGRGGVGLPCYFREEEFLRILREHLDRLLEPLLGPLRPGELFLEKTPSHSLYVSEIIELLPRARVIHLLRDARDVVASLLAASRSWGAEWAPRTARDAARVWASHVGAVRRAAEHMSDRQFLEVRYEDLHRSPVGMLGRIGEFLHLDWDDRSVESAVMRNSPEALKEGGGSPIPRQGHFGAVSGTVVKEPEGFVRTARPGGGRKELSFLQMAQLWLVARGVMKQVGYGARYGRAREGRQG